MGNGDFLLCTCKCTDVRLKLQGTEFYADLFVLAINGPDIVHWLQELGTVSQNFAKPAMELAWKGKQVQLEEDTALAPGKITFHQLQVLKKQDMVHGLFE